MIKKQEGYEGRFDEEASEKQLQWLDKLGYDIVDTKYTKKEAATIIGRIPASNKQKSYLSDHGVEFSDSLTLAEYYELEIKVKQSKKHKYDED